MDQPPKQIKPLPKEIWHMIFSYLSYEEVAADRQISKMFNTICSEILMSRFMAVRAQVKTSIKEIDARFPLKVQKKNANVYYHHYVLMLMDTHLDSASKTYDEYICSFIPGKVRNIEIFVAHYVVN